MRDTLSTYFDLGTFRMNVASHSYDWEITNQGILKVTFDDIMLPDSNVNEVRSHGFFKYSIQPKANVPLGTKVENSASIFFDFNAPVITNSVFHTIDTSFILTRPVDATFIQKEDFFLTTTPNPFQTSAIIQLNQAYEDLELMLFDITGKTIVTIESSGMEVILQRQHLQTGLYLFILKGDGRYLGKGKFVIK